MQPGPMELEAGSGEIQIRGPCLDILSQNLWSGAEDLHFEYHKLDFLKRKRKKQQIYTIMETEKKRESVAEVDTR